MQVEAKVQDARVDFDFLMGDWQGHNRRLRERLKGSTSWEEFSCELTVRPILGGLGNFDEVTFNREKGAARGATLRLFDIDTQQWRIYWADGSHGELDVPMVGSFNNGRGEFYAHEIWDKTPIFSRFIWTVISENTCRWEQAFSTDGGKTWETNWTTDFTRVQK